MNSREPLMFIVLLFTSAIHAQTSCQYPPTSGQGTWPQGASVTVNISPAFSSGEQDAIRTAFLTWQNANANFLGNGSGVTFTFISQSSVVAAQGFQVQSDVYQVNQSVPASGGTAATGGIGGSGQTRTSAYTNVSPGLSEVFLRQVMLHEIGHTFGLDNCNVCSPQASVMVDPVPVNDTSYIPNEPTACDNAVIAEGFYAVCQSAPPDPSCTCSMSGTWDCGQTGCSPEYDGSGGWCAMWDDSGSFCYFYSNTSTPIIIPLAQASQIKLTSIAEGVWFDLKAMGTPVRTAWTAANSNLGFLFLDRNGNGAVDDGSELFGDHTPLPNGETAKQGFEALAAFDQVAHGGNGDGWIDQRDEIWPSLRVWVDSSHDGISQPKEIFALESVNVSALSTDFISVMRRDADGNTLRYKAKAIVGGKVRWAHDVFFLTSASYSSAKGQVLGAPSLKSTVAAYFSPARGGSSCNLTALAR